jgi:hypothetical protein
VYIPVSLTGCSRKGTDLDFAFRELKLLLKVLGAVKERAEPRKARSMVARIMISILFSYGL